MLTISTHAPRTGSDLPLPGCCAIRCNFNPRSPHGERPASGLLDKFMGLDISTHAPRTGSDAEITEIVRSEEDFNPRSPHGERRVCYDEVM